MKTGLYPWQHQIWQQWQKMIKDNSVPHALLCAMPQGVGRETLVQYFAETLLCLTQDIEPCGFCHSCELLKSNTHPDLHWVITDEKNKSISVEQIRECNHWALESSQFSAKRVIIISPVEKMTESAGNALLKTLESPPQDCYFILLSESEHKLLPTIKSRCQLWKQPKISKEMIVAWLAETEKRVATPQVIALNDSLPLKIYQFLNDKKQEQHQALLANFARCVNSGFIDVSETVKNLLSLNDEGIHWLSYLLSDIQKVQLGALNNVIHVDELHYLKQLAQQISANILYQQYLALNRLRQQLSDFSGLNKELLITKWLFEFIEVK